MSITAVVRFKHECPSDDLCKSYGKTVTLRQPLREDDKSFYLMPSPRCRWTHVPLRQLSCEWSTAA